jgi:hypothetical protein
MIVFEERLGELVALLPPHINEGSTTEFPIKYGWGTQDELNKYLALPRQDSPYPLIWLINGTDKENLSEGVVRRRTNLLIATVSDKQSEMNPFIYQTDYKDVLVPVVENLIQVFIQSGISQIIRNEIERQFLPNFSVRENNGQIDVWNVISLDLELAIFSNTCINTIFFNN